MSLILKPIAIHSIVGGAPYIISVDATAAPQTPRVFQGTGAPSSSTLPAGNGMYNGISSGFILNASLVAAGTNYKPGDIVTMAGGTGTALAITVDMVTATGGILDYHTSAVGQYTAFPANPASVTGGSGTGATFNLNQPAPDYYFDNTTPSSPVMYVCSTSGTNSTSVWQKVSGGGGSTMQLAAIYSLSNADSFTAYLLGISSSSGSLLVNLTGPVTVAKNARQRVSVVSETLDSQSVAYTSYVGDNTRMAAAGSTSEAQVVFPPYVTMTGCGITWASSYTGAAAYSLLISQCVCKVVQMPSPIDTSATPAQYQEIEARVWARKYIQ